MTDTVTAPVASLVARDVEAMMRDAARKLGLALPRDLHVSFRPMADAYFRTQARPRALRVVINDAFASAPRDVLGSLAEVIVVRTCGKGSGRREGRAFWEWVERPEVKSQMQGNYLARQRSFVPGARGQHWDLGTLFDEVNAEMFEGTLERPLLAWSRAPLTYRWGWYSDLVEPRGVLVINRLLDDPQVPRFVVKGTVYHEMLHMVIAPKVTDGRRVVHTREFNEADRRFPGQEELRKEYRRILRRYARVLSAARWLRRSLRR